MIDTKDESLLKWFVIFLHIGNFLLIFVEVFNSIDLFSFVINSFMFFSSTAIGIYSLEPRTKQAKKSRRKLLFVSFWSAAICLFFLMLSLIKYEFIIYLLLNISKVSTVLVGAYCSYSLIKIDSEVSNNDKKYSKQLKSAIESSIMKKREKTPNEKKADGNKKTRRFIEEDLKKG